MLQGRLRGQGHLEASLKGEDHAAGYNSTCSGHLDKDRILQVCREVDKPETFHQSARTTSACYGGFRGIWHTLEANGEDPSRTCIAGQDAFAEQAMLVAR